MLQQMPVAAAQGKNQIEHSQMANSMRAMVDLIARKGEPRQKREGKGPPDLSAYGSKGHPGRDDS
jgi:hypothetical protein